MKENAASWNDAALKAILAYCRNNQIVADTASLASDLSEDSLKDYPALVLAGFHPEKLDSRTTGLLERSNKFNKENPGRLHNQKSSPQTAHLTDALSVIPPGYG